MNAIEKAVEPLYRGLRTYAAYAEKERGATTGRGVILTPLEAEDLRSYIAWLERPDDDGQRGEKAK